MTVHFIGAGPGAPDLLTLRARDLIAACPVCIYAGSLVPKGVLSHCPPDARLINSAPLDLDAIISEIEAAEARGEDVARLHSGDLSLWSALGEQIARLDTDGIPWTVTPGVPAFAAAAAALGAELTRPEVVQSVVLTRTPGRASAMPDSETLDAFARTGATLALHLSIQNLASVADELAPVLGSGCPIAVVHRASWPDQKIVRGTLADIATRIDASMTRTAMILIGPALGQGDFSESRLYATDYDRRWRPRGEDSPWQGWQTDMDDD